MKTKQLVPISIAVIAVMLLISQIQVVSGDATNPVSDQHTDQRTTQHASSGGPGGSSLNCKTPFKNRGTPSCFDTRRNIPAYSFNFCPVINPLFVTCVEEHHRNIFNRGRDFTTATIFWNSWYPIVSDHITFQQLHDRVVDGYAENYQAWRNNK